MFVKKVQLHLKLKSNRNKSQVYQQLRDKKYPVHYKLFKFHSNGMTFVKQGSGSTAVLSPV